MVPQTPVTWPGHTPPLSQPPKARRYACLHAGRELTLRPGQIIIGRSSRADILLDDALVSRRHARFLVSTNTLFIEDLSSANGVYVNETRIAGPTPIDGGDRIMIGGQELFIITDVSLREHPTQPPSMSERPTDAGEPAELDSGVHPVESVAEDSGERPKFADTSMSPPTSPPSSSPLELDEPGSPTPTSRPPLPPGFSSAAPAKRSSPDARAESPSSSVDTTKEDRIATLGRLADRMLGLGRSEAAERVLAAHLRELLVGAREGAYVPRTTVTAAGIYGMKIAAATRKGEWANIAIELHMIAKRPLPIPALNELESVLGVLRDFDWELLQFYKSALRSHTDLFSAAEGALVERICSLEPKRS